MKTVAIAANSFTLNFNIWSTRLTDSTL